MNDLSYVGLSQCFYCGEAKEVILDRRLKDSLPHLAVYDYEPCAECAELMRQGIMLLSVFDNEPAHNPSRSGKMCVVTEDAIRRMVVRPELADDIIAQRVTFITDTDWAKLGLPTEDYDGTGHAG